MRNWSNVSAPSSRPIGNAFHRCCRDWEGGRTAKCRQKEGWNAATVSSSAVTVVMALYHQYGGAQVGSTHVLDTEDAAAVSGTGSYAGQLESSWGRNDRGFE